MKILKFFLKLKLNDSQKLEFEKNLAKYYEDYKVFEKAEMTLLKKLQFATITNFNIDFVLASSDLLYSGQYNSFLYLSALFSIFACSIISYKMYKKQKSFLDNYDFSHCNPKKQIIIFVGSQVKTIYFLIGICFTFGSISSINFLSTEFLGYNGLREFGMYTGLHKDSPNFI